jgi:hypothetical protein
VTAQALDYPCAERLHPALLTTAQRLARWGMLSLASAQEEQLGRLSVATLRRIPGSLRRDRPRPLPRSPQDHNPWRRDVPMLRLLYNLQEPGHLEVDLVHHCTLFPAQCGAWSHRRCVPNLAMPSDPFCPRQRLVTLSFDLTRRSPRVS